MAFSPRELFCSGRETATEVVDRSVVPPDNRGVNLVRYYVIDVDPVRSKLSNLSVDNIDEWRERAKELRRKTAIDGLVLEVEAHAERWYSRKDIVERLSEPGAYESVVNAESDIAQIVKIIDESAYVNCASDEYVYRIAFGIPLQPLDAVPDIRDAFTRMLEKGVGRTLEGFGSTKERVRVAIPGDIEVWFEREGDEVSALASLLDRHKGVVQLLGADTMGLLDWMAGRRVSVAPFSTAGHQLSGGMTAVLALLVKVFVSVIPKGRAYEFQSFGTADSRSVLSPLPFLGAANLALAQGQVEVFRPGSNEKYLRSNLELSIARGYAGAEAIAMLLQAEGVDRKGVPVGVLYGGLGAVPGAPLSSNRRLEIELVVRR